MQACRSKARGTDQIVSIQHRKKVVGSEGHLAGAGVSWGPIPKKARSPRKQSTVWQLLGNVLEPQVGLQLLCMHSASLAMTVGQPALRCKDAGDCHYAQDLMAIGSCGSAPACVTKEVGSMRMHLQHIVKQHPAAADHATLADSPSWRCSSNQKASLWQHSDSQSSPQLLDSSLQCLHASSQDGHSLSQALRHFSSLYI